LVLPLVFGFIGGIAAVAVLLAARAVCAHPRGVLENIVNLCGLLCPFWTVVCGVLYGYAVYAQGVPTAWADREIGWLWEIVVGPAIVIIVLFGVLPRQLRKWKGS